MGLKCRYSAALRLAGDVPRFAAGHASLVEPDVQFILVTRKDSSEPRFILNEHCITHINDYKRRISSHTCMLL